MIKTFLKSNNIKFNLITLIFVFSCILVGSFYEEISCILTVLLSVAIFLSAKKNKCITVKLNALFITACVTVAGYLLSVLWAVDSGMAFLGFVKYLPLLLFIILISQESETKENLLKMLPYFALLLTVITVVLMQIPPLKTYFSVAGRFSGCFQYPNTFAIFLLVSELLVISKDTLKIRDVIVSALLFGGVLYTGSRTVFVLSVLSNAVLLFFGKSKKIKLCFLGACAVCVIGVAAITLVMGQNAFGRFLTISLKESTFVGRFLYFKDGIPVILKHPFGLGYSGYYYIQQTIQTGVYSLRHIHNDFLQLALDVGWIPLISVAVTILLTFLNKKVTWQRKLILLTFFLHSCFDFNLQYISMCFILVLLVDTKGEKAFELKSLLLVTVILSIFSAISIYFGVVIAAYRFSANPLAEKLYPYYTDNNIELLKKSEDAETMNDIAEKILEQNEYLSVCYSAKARFAYSQGKFKDVMDYKHLVFEYAPFSYSDYEEYCYMLVNGIALYTRDGDTYSADYCRKELVNTYNNLQVLPDKLSYLGTMIKDQPQTELPKDLLQYIAKISGEME